MDDTNTAREFWVREPGRGELRESRLPPPGEGTVRVRTLFSGISRGTEGLVFRGEVPESQHEAMRAPFQEGDFPGPVKYGYMSVGRVEAGPGELRGREVFCLHPHQDLYQVPASAVTPLPASVPPGRGILAAQMETAVNGIWDGRVTVGDRVVVVGAGTVGLLVARLCRGVPGTRVTAVDPEPTRAEPARALGVELVPEPPGEDGADVVFHASGQPAGLRAALAMAGPDATVVEMSWFGTRDVALPLGESFHSRRIRLRSSQVGSVPPGRRPRWDRRRRLALALELLAEPALDALISGESAFDELPRVMPRLVADPAGTLCHRVRYPAADR